MKNASIALIWMGLLAASGNAAAVDQVLVEAESFADPGGWMLDTQFIDNMGSPYLLAHGLGRPVEDATTEIQFPEAGTYRVFVRTKDWVARWKAPGQPGRFQLLVDGRPLTETFGTQGAEWFWHDGGVVELDGTHSQTGAARSDRIRRTLRRHPVYQRSRLHAAERHAYLARLAARAAGTA